MNISPPNTIPTAILLIGYGHQDPKQAANFQQFAARLADPLGQMVIPCPLDRAGNPIMDGIRAGLQQGAVKFVVLPLIISPAEYRETALTTAIEWASRRWSFLSFHVAPPLDWQAWTAIFAAAIQPQSAEPSETGVILVSDNRHQDDAQIEIAGDLAKLGHILQAQHGFSRVEIITRNHDAASLESAFRHCKLAAANQIIVVPTYLFGGEQLSALVDNVAHVAATSETDLKIIDPLENTTSFMDRLVSQYQAGLADDSLLPVSWDEVRRQVEASNADHRPQSNILGQTSISQTIPDDEAQFQSLTNRINEILPPRYQQTNQNGQEGSPEVSPAPMAAADLKFDGEGNVAWDQMWGLDDPDSPFCELALAGGPAHRGDLLEPVTAAECASASGKYAAVLAELKRGIQLVAGLPAVDSSSLGWIGVQCESDEMAIWLLRAIIVENVMVRREADVLYLPAGPEFALAGEIKNVVTVVAKTVHYWNEHSLAMSMRMPKA